MQKILCLLNELDDPGAMGVVLELPGSGKPIEILLVRKGGDVYAYHNRCPHTGIQLEWMPDQFLDLDKHYIQCATHGALFRMQDGYCLRGPCAGDFLTQLNVQLMDGSVMMTDWNQLMQLQS
jgi:nitrite reductase/ring-hydroxylating ferredoxin subunit